MTYDPPPLPRDRVGPIVRPATITWFYVYCGTLVFVYLLTAAAGGFLMAFADRMAETREDEIALPIMGAVFLIMGAGLAGLAMVPWFLPRRKWVWVFDLVIICLGLTNACWWPICIPLLVFWLKEPTRRWFGYDRGVV